MLSIATFVSFVAALPPTSPLLKARDAQIVHLVFHGGPASYNMTIPADGQVYPTGMLGRDRKNEDVPSLLICDSVNQVVASALIRLMPQTLSRTLASFTQQETMSSPIA